MYWCHSGNHVHVCSILCRYSQLLGYSENDLFEELALFSVKQGKHDQAVNLCWSVIFFSARDLRTSVVFNWQILFFVMICRDLVKSSPKPSTALLLMAVVQEMWERARCYPGSVNKEDIKAMRQLAAYTATLCHGCKYTGSKPDKGIFCVAFFF